MTRRLRSSVRRPRAAPSIRACSSPPTARPGCCGRRMETAAVCRPPSIPNSSPPTGSRPPGHHIVSSARRRRGKGISSRARPWSSPAGTFWLFYSANLWGTPNYGIGIARCASVTGPCTKPLGHAWLSASTPGQSAPGPGGEEFFEIGGVVWMVHHALAPGQSGNLAQRRLYVDLVAFPPGRLPSARPGRAGRGAGRGDSVRERPPAVPAAAGVPDPAPSGRSTLAPGE